MLLPCYIFKISHNKQSPNSKEQGRGVFGLEVKLSVSLPTPRRGKKEFVHSELILSYKCIPLTCPVTFGPCDKWLGVTQR